MLVLRVLWCTDGCFHFCFPFCCSACHWDILNPPFLGFLSPLAQHDGTIPPEKRKRRRERSSASRPKVGRWQRASGSACCAWVPLGCNTSLHFWWRQLCASLRQPSHMAICSLSLLWLWSWKHRKKWIIYCWFCYTFWLGKKKMCRHVPIACPGSALSSSLLLLVSPTVMFSHSVILPPLYFSDTIWSSVLLGQSGFITCLTHTFAWKVAFIVVWKRVLLCTNIISSLNRGQRSQLVSLWILSQ